MPRAYQPSKVLGFWSVVWRYSVCSSINVSSGQQRSALNSFSWRNGPNRRCLNVSCYCGMLDFQSRLETWFFIFFFLNHLVNSYRQQFFWLTLNPLRCLWRSLMRSNRYSHYISLQQAFGQSEKSGNHLLMPPSPQETGHRSSVWCRLSVVLFSSQPC